MTVGKGKFEQDITTLVARLSVDMNEQNRQKLNKLKNDLITLQKQNVVKINHSVMELVCAKYLILKEYNLEVEYPLNEILTCDLYSTKGFGNLIVEIETGYIPPEHAMAPLTYTFARLASKIVRYSCFAGKFAIGVPPHYVLPLPTVLALPPRRRTPNDVEYIKNLCDKYYQKPPVTEEGIRNARIHEIYLIDVDRLRVQAMDPEAYMKRALNKGVVFTPTEEAVLEARKAPRQAPKNEQLDHYIE
ncbi:MAG: hypothetical protein NWF00_12625 [Candidatus Bathyarchaeota archaeon]|nr:hypothetical protein [Candidatus Bathyarchaeota archaeon]